MASMSASLHFASIRSSSPGEVVSGVAEEFSFNPTTLTQFGGRPVVRLPEQLRLHRALDELGWTGLTEEINKAARLKHESVPEPILITSDGTILAGFGPVRLAIFDGRREIPCIEYPLSDEEALRFILTYHRPQRLWNAFVRIRLALTQEPSLQQKALDNMRAGGKEKGSANLRNLRPVDSLQEIASLAGVGTRNVSNVKTILQIAHPRLISALRDGTLTINGAMQLCKLPPAEQLQQFVRSCEERVIKKLIRRAVALPKEEKNRPDVLAVLDALQQQEAQQPGSVDLRIVPLQHTVVLIGQDLLNEIVSQKELKLP
jgi:hypothetical protein